jgi:hypothetical protein
MRVEFEIPDAVFEEMLGHVVLPRVARVRYAMPTPAALSDVSEVVRLQLRSLEIRSSIGEGQSVAIGAGSRGIGSLPEIVRALVEELKAWGARPFIVPTMGSHGGATPEGQKEVLAHLGITEESVGAPIRSSMEVVTVGRTADGSSVYMDRLASEADSIVFVARVKPHTAFRGTYESGLAKMVAIGLGKQAGAAATHARGFGEMARMVPEMAEVALKAAPIRFGIAVLENAHDRPFRIEAVPASRTLADEPALLRQAKAAMPRIPFDAIDVLVIDQIGKNISGDGADPNITGRYPTPYASGGPIVNKQVVLDLSEGSAGNANGIGLADYTTLRLARKMDLAKTYPNALTSTVPGPVALPMVLPSDRLALAAAVLTCNAVGREPRVVRIVDTLHLEDFWVSEALLDEVARDSRMEVTGGPQPFGLDGAGDLEDLAAFVPRGAPEGVPEAVAQAAEPW